MTRILCLVCPRYLYTIGHCTRSCHNRHICQNELVSPCAKISWVNQTQNPGHSEITTVSLIQITASVYKLPIQDYYLKSVKKKLTANFYYIVLTKFHINSWSSFPDSKTTPCQALAVTLTILTLRHFGAGSGCEGGQVERMLETSENILPQR